AQFSIPNRPGAVIEIIGRAANSNNGECPYELSPLTRWQIGQSGGLTQDVAAPVAPFFGLSLSTTQGGTVELSPLGFSDLANTKSIAAGTYAFHYYDELAGPPTITLAVDAGNSDTHIVLSQSSTAQVNDFVQLEDEVLQMTAVSTDGLTLDVTRGM